MISSFLLPAIFAVAVACIPQPIPQTSTIPPPISVTPSIIPLSSETTTLYPAVHWRQDRTDLSVLDPSYTNELYYTNDGGLADPAVQHVYSNINSSFVYNSVVLQHSAYIQDVHCVSDGLEVIFSNAKAFDAAQKSWSNTKDVVMIATDIVGCSTPNPGQHAYWKATGLTFSASDLAVHIICHEIPMNQLFKDVDMDWGTYYPASSKPSTVEAPVKSCGSPPSNMFNGFPAAACGTEFDQTLDSQAGYIPNDGNILRTFAPGLHLNSKRALGGLTKRGAATAAVKAVGDAANTIVKGVNDGIAAVQSATVVDVPPISFDFPLTVTPPSTDKSPFNGPALLLFWEEKAFNNGVGTKFDVFCVNCGATGDFKVAGRASFSVLPVPVLNSGSIDFNGNIQASLSLGINATITIEKKVTKSLKSTGLPGFSIPNIIEIGPSISLDSEFDIKLAANGLLQAGASLSIPDFKSTIDFVDSSKSTTSGFKPSLSPIFFAQGSITGSVSYSLPVTLELGIIISPINFNKGVKLIDRPTAKASVAVNGQTGNIPSTLDTSKCINGITFQVDITNDISVDLLGLNAFQLLHSELPALPPTCTNFKNKRSVSDSIYAGLELSSAAPSIPMPSSLGEWGPGNPELSSSMWSTIVTKTSATSTSSTPIPVAPSSIPTGQADTTLSAIVDVTGNYSLAISSKGSFIVAPKTNPATFTTIASGSVAIADSNQTPFFYYSNTMSTYGISRFRSTDTDHLPLSSRLVTLTALNIATSPANPEAVGKGVFMALDTEDNWFWPVVCKYVEGQGMASRVFLVKDVKEGIETLESDRDEIRWGVTGGVVERCIYRPFIAEGKGL